MNVSAVASSISRRGVGSSPGRPAVGFDASVDRFVPMARQEDALSSTLSRRGARDDVKQALMGGLITLDDTQVRDRPGRGSSEVDSSQSGDGYRSTLQLHLPWKLGEWTVPALSALKNLPGEWNTEVHLHALALGSDKALVSIPDSNAFVPAAAACSLSQIREDNMNPEDAVVTEMRRQALDNVRLYRHPEGGYNFYPRNPDGTGVKPLNLPVGLLKSSLVRKVADKLGIMPKAWLDQVFDRQRNSGGANTVTNIPNDANDTGLAVAAQELGRRQGLVAGDAASIGIVEGGPAFTSLSAPRDSHSGSFRPDCKRLRPGF